MPDTFIIDAYNVIRLVLPESEASLRSDAARHALETRLRAFRRASGPGTRIFLVYDGELGRPAPARREKGFEIYFSRPPRKADDVVLDLAQKHEGEPGVHVVTSDFTDIAHRICGLRVKHWTAHEFAQVCARRTAPARREPAGGPDDGPAKPQKVSPADVSAWMREFGFDGDSPGGTGKNTP